MLKKFISIKNRLNSNSKELIFWCFIVGLHLILRLPNLFMPHWNFDEGVYLSVGSDLNNGFDLYQDSWDHKPPILYWVYQILLKVSSGGYFIFPFVNFFLGLITIYLIYRLSKEFIALKYVYFVTSLSTIFLGFGFWEAGVFNAENLFVPIVLTSYLIFLTKKKWFWDILLGFLIFLATATKVHAVVELVGFFLGFILINTGNWKQVGFRYLKISLTTLALWILLFIGFASNNQLQFSFNSIFTYNTQYVQTEDKIFATVLGVPLFNGKNNRPDQNGLSDLQWRTIVLITITFLAAYFSLKTKSNSKNILFFTWFTFTFYAVTLSGRNYSHYLVQIIPAITIGFGLIYQKTEELWQTNFKKLLKSRVFPVIVSCLIWVYLVQSLVFIFASGMGSSRISLDVFPVEVTYRDFYLNLASGNIGKWQKEIRKNTYWYYPMDEIIQTAKELTPKNGRFWHYSNISALCYYTQLKCGYTAHLWFHLEGEVLVKTISNLEKRPPDLIFVDKKIESNGNINDFMKKYYKLEKTLPDVFNGSNRFEFWVLK